MVKKFLIKFVFDFLKAKALQIAHPQLRQSAMVTIGEAEKLAEYFLTHDFSVPETAQKFYDDSLPTFSLSDPKKKELKPVLDGDKSKLHRVPTDAIPPFDDKPKKRSNRTKI